jgi:uncharacterized membrane protein
MKYLKYLLYVLAVIIVLVIIKVATTPSVAYQSEVSVNKPVEEAWAVMNDEQRLPEWIKGFKRMELKSGNHNSAGAVYKVYIDDNGQEMTMEETITAVKHNVYIAMTFTMDFMNMNYEMFLKQKDGKTHIETKSYVVGNNILARTLIAFMSGSMKAQEDENLSLLKKAIEENTKNYFQETEPDIVQEQAS